MLKYKCHHIPVWLDCQSPQSCEQHDCHCRKQKKGIANLKYNFNKSSLSFMLRNIISKWNQTASLLLKSYTHKNFKGTIMTISPSCRIIIIQNKSSNTKLMGYRERHYFGLATTTYEIESGLILLKDKPVHFILHNLPPTLPISIITHAEN